MLLMHSKLKIKPATFRTMAGFACVFAVFSLAISLTRGALLAFLIVGNAIRYVKPFKKVENLSHSYKTFFFTKGLILAVTTPVLKNI